MLIPFAIPMNRSRYWEAQDSQDGQIYFSIYPRGAAMDAGAICPISTRWSMGGGKFTGGIICFSIYSEKEGI